MVGSSARRPGRVGLFCGCCSLSTLPTNSHTAPCELVSLPPTPPARVTRQHGSRVGDVQRGGSPQRRSGRQALRRLGGRGIRDARTIDAGTDGREAPWAGPAGGDSEEQDTRRRDGRAKGALLRPGGRGIGRGREGGTRQGVDRFSAQLVTVARPWWPTCVVTGAASRWRTETNSPPASHLESDRVSGRAVSQD